MPRTHVALLRGVNLGGYNKLPMVDLRRILEGCGVKNVVTYIQSGNAVFQASRQTTAKLASKIEAALEKEMGWTVPVAVFTRDEFQAAVNNNPYPEAVATPKQLLAMFLTMQPKPEHAANLDPNRGTPDRFTLVDRVLYVHLAGGAADTKLTNQYFDSRLKVVATGRNWLTVLELFKLVSE